MSPVNEVVIEQIKEIFVAKGLKPPAVDENSPVDGSLGLDSMDFAELAVRLEGIYGHDPFASGVVPPLRTVADLAALYD